MILKKPKTQQSIMKSITIGDINKISGIGNTHISVDLTGVGLATELIQSKLCFSSEFY